MQYNSLLYENRPVKYSDYISNKYNIVHNKLYLDALNKYIDNYIVSSLSGKFLYRIFKLLERYFNENPDLIKKDVIDHEETFDKIHGMTIIPLSEIVSNPAYLSEHMQELLDLVNTDDVIREEISKLNILSNNKRQYIHFLVVNLFYFIYCLKDKISNNGIVGLIDILDITDFIIKSKNNSYVLREDENNIMTLVGLENNNTVNLENSSENALTEEDGEIVLLFNTEEDNDIVFIYEDEEYGRIHIGYSSSGKWIIDIASDETEWLNNIEFTNLISRLNGNINTNLWKLLISNIKEMYLRTHRIIEQKNVEYWMPSKILIITTFYPYKKDVVDLSPWWNRHQEYKELEIDKLIANKDYNLVDGKVQYIDYVRGKAKVYSRMANITKTVDLNYINADTEVDNEATLANTFAYKLNNL